MGMLIRMLGEETACSSPGDIVEVLQITDGEIYFEDSCGRYVFLYLSEEGLYWEWVQE